MLILPFLINFVRKIASERGKMNVTCIDCISFDFFIKKINHIHISIVTFGVSLRKTL